MDYAKPRRYEVTDSRGQVHKRKSPRVYTHAVVHHAPARAATGNYRASEAYSKAAWCGRADLANKEASVWSKHGWQVEIIPIPAA